MNFWCSLQDFFSDKEEQDEPVYDPIHIGGVIAGSIFTLGVVFWLLWALLVYGGGLLTKVVPFIQVLFSKKTLHDFGYEGYPYEMGIFQGWFVNVGAFFLLILALWGIEKIFQNKPVLHDSLK